LVEGIKVLANKKDVPYQSMLKILLADKVREEFTTSKNELLRANQSLKLTEPAVDDFCTREMTSDNLTELVSRGLATVAAALRRRRLSSVR